MVVSGKLLKSPLAIGTCITIIVTAAGTAYALLYSQQGAAASKYLLFNTGLQGKGRVCKTIVSDPQPPLNVRSTPIVQQDNRVGVIENGVEVTIVAEQDGWFQLSQPVPGWISKKLTQTDCGDSNQAASAASASVVKDPPPSSPDRSTDRGNQLLEQARTHYQAGNLKGAIALAQEVPIESAAYDKAQDALRIMPQLWDQAKAKYVTAEKARNDKRWNDVLKIATEYPDIRYWRQRLAPIVKAATLKQQNSLDGSN
jgi:hypothetical protein